MAHRQVYPTRTGRYGTRMLTAGEPMTVPGPLAREMVALGRATLEKPKMIYKVGDGSRESFIPLAKPEAVDERVALRAEYEAKFSKKPFGGWSAELLREKIAAA